MHNNAAVMLMMSRQPSWLPRPLGKTPVWHADFVQNRYWFGAIQTTEAAWLAAVTGSSFTQAGTPTYVNASKLLANGVVNTLRIDHDPVTGERLGAILEAAASSNAAFPSEDFTDAAWTKTNVTVTANTTAAPDGATTADTITAANAGVIAHEVSQLLSPHAGTVGFAISVDTPHQAKFLNVSLSAGANEYYQQVFDIWQACPGESSKGSVSTDAIISNVHVKPAANGCVRFCAFIKLVSGSAANPTLHYGIAKAAFGNTYNSLGSAIFEGAGVSLTLWGAQAEPNVVAVSSYIKTTSAAVNRAADNLKIGVDFDGNLGLAKIFVMEFDSFDNLSQGGNANFLTAYTSPGNPVFQTKTDAAGFGVLRYPDLLAADGNVLVDPSPNRVAIRVASTYVEFCLNGLPIESSAIGALRSAMTYVSPGGSVPAMRLRSITAFADDNDTPPMSNPAMENLAMPRSFAVPGPATSVIVDGDTNYNAWPGLAVNPLDGYLVSTFARYATASLGGDSKIYYKTAPAIVGPWTARALVYDPGVGFDAGSADIAALSNGTLIQSGMKEAYPPVGTSILHFSIGTPQPDHTITWGSPIVPGGPYYFTGTVGPWTGDFAASRVFEITQGVLAGYLAYPFYGYVSGDTLSSVGMIFSPDFGATWGDFTIIARAVGSIIQFDESNGFECDEDSVTPGRLVVIIRNGLSGFGYSRVICDDDPRDAVNWTKPAHCLDNTGEGGKPDVCYLGGDNVYMMTRKWTGISLTGWTFSAKAGEPGSFGLLSPYLIRGTSPPQYYYSASIKGPDCIVSAICRDGPSPLGAPSYIDCQSFMPRLA